MLAGRPHEAAGNGSPRWMTVAPRKRGHRTRPTGRLTRPGSLTEGLLIMLGSTGFRLRKGSFCWLSPSAGHGGQEPIGH